MLRCAIIGLWAIALNPPAYASCGDTGDTGDVWKGLEDCDEDGWQKNEGDCDDEDETISPGEPEDCIRAMDENCDGFFNEGCESTVQHGSLQGGSACGTGVTSGGIGPLALAMLAFRRRR
jgi:hypothetical protein